MGAGPEWTTYEIAFLRRHYPAGVSAEEIGRRLNRTRGAVVMMASHLKLRHPRHSSAQLIANFEQQHGMPLELIAIQYRDRKLSRRSLCEAIGIARLALKNALSDELWQSWPRMTIGRIDACRERRKSA